MNKIIIIFLIPVVLFGCSKLQDKKTTEDSKVPVQQTPSVPKTEKNLQSENKSSGQTDEKAIELAKSADEAITKYAADKSEAAKNNVITKCLAAANYIEFEANLPAREKYRPALKYYRKVLELDPDNADAEKNKKEIEDIYKQMGMPVPQ